MIDNTATTVMVAVIDVWPSPLLLSYDNQCTLFRKSCNRLLRSLTHCHFHWSNRHTQTNIHISQKSINDTGATEKAGHKNAGHKNRRNETIIAYLLWCYRVLVPNPVIWCSTLCWFLYAAVYSLLVSCYNELNARYGAYQARNCFGRGTVVSNSILQLAVVSSLFPVHWRHALNAM